MRQLYQWRWLFKKKAGMLKAAPALKMRSGGNGDFLGHHPYTWGDDLRHLDWYVYGRSGQLFVQDFSEEGRLGVLILIDGSGSMLDAKFRISLQIGAALAYLGLQHACPVQLGVAAPEICYSPFFAGPGHFRRALRFLSWRKSRGKLCWHSLGSSVTRRRQSLIFLCSDLLAAQEGEGVLKRLALEGHYLVVLHVTAAEEMRKGAVCLWDVETGEERLFFVDEEIAAGYQKALDNFKKKWRNFCEKYKIAYASGNCHSPVYAFLSPVLEPLGWFS